MLLLLCFPWGYGKTTAKSVELFNQKRDFKDVCNRNDKNNKHVKKENTEFYETLNLIYDSVNNEDKLNGYSQSDNVQHLLLFFVGSVGCLVGWLADWLFVETLERNQGNKFLKINCCYVFLSCIFCHTSFASIDQQLCDNFDLETFRLNFNLEFEPISSSSA
ncbi:hypothetical protein FF38_00693 [Lucilia cuprina]|uniref:Major facilitator superfamily associated domain-containing protein n=1 Tax=Lucilia cuprina TaxID=7375 RepID=A0A0L0BQ84_LUCCU|nr:hypothetical protein FF38_00693 [Lucilia cuprina]